MQKMMLVKTGIFVMHFAAFGAIAILLFALYTLITRVVL